MGKIEKQCLVLYYGFSGQGIQINLSCIDNVKGIQDGGQIAFIGIQDGGQVRNLFENREVITSRINTLQLEYKCKVPCGIDC